MPAAAPVGSKGAIVGWMARASFRFYAQLNDFLAPARRGQRFTHEVELHSTLKDTIESLGVPHSEVDLLVVNGEVADFDRRVHDCDVVAVYPRFWSITPGEHERLSSAIPAPVRFAADVHLAKLARRLRLAGFDVVSVAADPDLALTSARDARIVLTRDRELLKRRAVRAGYWIRHADPDAQFVEVLSRFDLARQVTPFTRCLRCNTLLERVRPEAAIDRLPPGFVPPVGDVHACPSCRRVYWRGSHYDRLRRCLHEALERAAAG
jgi:uncharacterized protein with PIN domain